jgi:hypothetical protein
MAAMRFVILSLLLLLPSCTYIQGDDRVFVASEPAGARIYVDGMDIGHTTPYQFNLANWGSHDHTITVAKKGYDEESRHVYRHRQTRTSQWKHGAVEDLNFTWPVFWTFGDFFLPFEYRWEFVPRELFVQLYPAGQGPVKAGSDSTDKADSVGGNE